MGYPSGMEEEASMEPQAQVGYRDLTDEQAIERVLAGDTPAFEAIMRRYNQRLFRAARAILRSDLEAEDVMQDAYVRAYAHLAEFAGRARFSTWLTKIAVHEALARVRRQRRFDLMDPSEEKLPGASELPPADPEQTAATKELAGVIEQAIDTLPDGFRTVFMLRAVEEMSVAETAECLEIPEETVKTRLHRARAQLQKRLETHTESALRQTHRFYMERCDRVVAAVLARLAAQRLGGDTPDLGGAR